MAARKGRPLLAAALSLALAAFSLSGCGTGKGAQAQHSSAAPAAVTLSFISSWGGSDPKANAIQNLLDAFSRQNPNIKVSNQSVFGDDFLPYLKTAFVSGNDPDVFGLWPGSDVDSMITHGKVADLTGLFEADPSFKGSFGSDMWQYATYNGRVYGLPMEIIFEGLYINKDLFARHNVAVPRNFAQLKEAVRKFAAAGVTPIAYNNTAEGTYIYQNIAASIGGKAAIEHPIEGGKVNACYLAAMEDMRTLYDLHAFPADYLTLTSSERNTLFTDKQAAMIAQGSWFAAGVPENSDVAFVRFPDCSQNGAGSSRIVYGLGNGVLHMSEKAWAAGGARRVAAVKLLRYLASPASAKVLAQQTGMLSNVKFSGSVSYNAPVTAGLSLIAQSKELIGPPDSYISRHSWENVIVQEFPSLFERSKTPAQIWQDAVNDGAAQD